jgi:hypothetical protein
MQVATELIHLTLHEACRECEQYSEAIVTAIHNVDNAVRSAADREHFEALYREMTMRISNVVMTTLDEDASYTLYDVMLMLYARMQHPVAVLYPGATCVPDNRLYFA